MSFFKKVFSSTSATPQQETESRLPAISTGRYTEVNKKALQTSYWSKAQDEFARKNYVEAYNNLLLYMLDPAIENLTINKRADAIDFEIIQGSKIIRGKGDAVAFTAEARIARFDRLNVAFMRKLMSMNYIHQYTRFAIKDDVIYLRFDSKAIDASPNKLYYSLKELALKADKTDDALVSEFEMLHAIDVTHLVPLADTVKEIKFKYLQQWINEMLDKVASLNEDRLSGGISYIILATMFRIDYLIQPQGNFYEAIDKINAVYNAKDNATTLQKNRGMLDEFRKLASRSKEDIFKELYEVKLTFGFVPPSSHKTFYEFLVEQFKNTAWYFENGYADIATYLYEWMIGYSLYYYGLFPATYDYLKLAYAVLMPDYFTEMGFAPELYNKANRTFDKVAIENEIQQITKKYSTEYPKLAILKENIRYTNMNDFLYTYLNELTYLNFSK